MIIIARVTHESSIESRENDFLLMRITRQVMAEIARTTRHSKDRMTLYHLRPLLVESINYRSSNTVSKKVKINENLQKSYFAVHIMKRIIYVI